MSDTARDFCTLALKEAGVTGVGQTPLPEDINDTFTLLQRMMGQWQKKRWLVPMLIDVKANGNSNISNTIGDGEYYNTPRPDKIQAAYFIQKNNGPSTVSYPLEMIWSYEDYIRVALKTLNSFPAYCFYDGAFPSGNVFIWPIPTDQYEVHLIVKGALGFPTDLDQEILLPPEYEEAIHYNLTRRVMEMYNYDIPPSKAALARASLNTIKVANAQIPTMIMPFGLGNKDFSYNALAGGGSFSPVSNPVPVVITTATANIDADQSIYFINHAGPVTLQLTKSSARSNLPVIIKDISGNASVNNITIVPYGLETIDGLATYPINSDYGAVNLQPSDSGFAVIT